MNSHALPPGWVVAVDEHSGKTYFANIISGETSWVPPPPPPPLELKVPPQSMQLFGQMCSDSSFISSAEREIHEASVSNMEPMELNLTAGIISDLSRAQFIHEEKQSRHRETYIPINISAFPKHTSIPYSDKENMSEVLIRLKEKLSHL